MRNESKLARRHRLLSNLEALGFSFDEANALRRIELTLHRWAELECGNGNDYASWGIERDEKTSLPYLVTHPHKGAAYRNRIPDREKGALKRLDRIMADHPDYVAYYQSDCRGCMLYIVSKKDVAGRDLKSCYTSGLAVCD
jgi:hypothetical protein